MPMERALACGCLNVQNAVVANSLELVSFLYSAVMKLSLVVVVVVKNNGQKLSTFSMDLQYIHI
jgi:hypothetical protein